MSRKYQTDDLVLFSQHVGSAMKLGVPLHQTVELLSGEMINRSFRKALSHVAADLKAGEGFYEALAKHDRLFPEFYLRVLKAGEESGTLPDTMNQLSDLLQKNFILSQRLRRVFAYPVTVFTLLAAMGALYTGFILPNFAAVYEELGAELPPQTQFLFKLQGFFFPVALIAGILLFLLARRFARAGWCGLAFDRFDLNFPFLGVFTRYALASRLTRSLAIMLRNGITLPESMRLCASMVDNKVAERSLNAARESVERGETLGAALLSESLFPPTMVWMLSAAEVRGDFVGSLDHLSEFYAVKVENTASWFLEILEPLLILIVGGLLVVLAFGIFGPIFSLVSVIS
jgi:type II secretory pathway component PulF